MQREFGGVALIHKGDVKGEGGAMIERIKTWGSGSLFAACLCALLICATNLHAQETMRFESEAKKLEHIREMVLKENSIRPSDSNRGLCQEMMKDFIAGGSFKAIEPYIRADSADDPRLKKWGQCRGRDYHEFKVDPNLMFAWLPQLGAPPYRFYRLELDGNKKNGLEDLLYHSRPSQEKEVGDVGYTWVDLKNCEMKKRFNVTGDIKLGTPTIYLNTLAKYNNHICIVDYVEGFHLQVSRWVNPARMEICRWSFLLK